MEGIVSHAGFEPGLDDPKAGGLTTRLRQLPNGALCSNAFNSLL